MTTSSFGPGTAPRLFAFSLIALSFGVVVLSFVMKEPDITPYRLRSLIFTMDEPFMKEKTLRYPGHVDLMRAFRETGFFSKDPVSVGGQLVRPLDATAAVLFPKWTFAEGAADLTVMRVSV